MAFEVKPHFLFWRVGFSFFLHLARTRQVFIQRDSILNVSEYEDLRDKDGVNPQHSCKTGKINTVNNILGYGNYPMTNFIVITNW